MQIGMVGFAGAGKSTLYTALSGLEPTSPGGNIMTHRSMAVVKVPDERLEWLRELFKPRKFTPATVEFVDFAGIPRTAEKGKAELFARIRDTDALLLVVSAFPGAADAVESPGTPANRVRALEDELLFADLEVVERRMERLNANLKKGMMKTRERDSRELDLMERCRTTLEAGQSLRDIARNREEEEMLAAFRFLRRKPRIVAINAGEQEDLEQLRRQTAEMDGLVFVLLGEVEAEIARMATEDRGAFLAEYGLVEPARDAVIRAAFQAADTIPFFTVGEDEVRAWVICNGDDALTAAGKIHSDIARGFIRAEVIAYADLKEAGSMREVKARHGMRLEGKDYRVQDGEIVHFRFSV